MREGRRARLQAEILDVVVRRVRTHLLDDLRGRAELETLLDRASRREIDPWEAADAILRSGTLAE